MKKKLLILSLLFLLSIFMPAVMADSDNEASVSPVKSTAQKIVFSSKRDGNFEIYTIREDGGDLQRLTHSKTDELKPNWSPDGAKILYFSKKGSRYELWVMNSDGSGQTKLAENCMINYLPAWSPDSSKIVFVANNGRQNAVYAVDVDGSDLILLSERDLEGSAPSWSPDGSKILFLQKKKDDVSIYLINPDGSGRQKLIRDPGVCLTPTSSPDGRKIAFIFKKQAFIGRENKLYVMNMDGSENQPIIEVSKKVQDIDFDDDLCWSPDGKQIAFTKMAKVEAKDTDSIHPTFIFTFGTYIIAADGNSNEIQLGKTGTDRAFPCWSPDSSRVAFLSNSQLHFYTLKSGINKSIQVDASLPLSRLQWSPDGKKIIFAAKNSSFQKSGLYLVDLDGKVTKLTESGDYDPVWAPANPLK